MSDLAAIHAAIVARMTAVPDIGRVHDRERMFSNEVQLRAFYGWPENAPKSEIRGWFAQLSSFAGVLPRIGRGRRLNVHWRIVGFVSIRDAEASETALRDLIEAIGAVFDADPRLGGAVQRCAHGDGEEAVAGIQCHDIAPVRLGNAVACHRVILSLPTQHFAS